MRLTEQNARDLPRGGRIKDHVVAGLELRAKATGKFWFLYYRHAGKQKRPKLGAYPAIDVARAREIARDWHSRIAGGEDPSGDRQALRDAPSVSALADRYLREYAAGRYKARTLEQADYIVRIYVRPALGSLRVREVGTDHVEALLHKLRNKPATSNRVRAYLSKMFALAERWHWRPVGTNPVVGTVQRRESRRRRYATADELRRIGDALDHYRDTYPAGVALIFCLVFSGARVTELSTARRRDREGAAIILRDHKSDRTGEVRVIRLPRQAVEILDALPPAERVFGGIDRFGVRTVWDKVRERAGVQDITIHDLRRTFATFVRSGGGNLETAGALLGHSGTQATQRYAYLFEDKLDAVAQSAADRIEAALRGD